VGNYTGRRGGNQRLPVFIFVIFIFVFIFFVFIFIFFIFLIFIFVFISKRTKQLGDGRDPKGSAENGP